MLALRDRRAACFRAAVFGGRESSDRQYGNCEWRRRQTSIGGYTYPTD